MQYAIKKKKLDRLKNHYESMISAESEEGRRVLKEQVIRNISGQTPGYLLPYLPDIFEIAMTPGSTPESAITFMENSISDTPHQPFTIRQINQIPRIFERMRLAINGYINGSKFSDYICGKLGISYDEFNKMIVIL